MSGDSHENPWRIFFDAFEEGVAPQWWLEDLRQPNGPYIPMKDKDSARRVADERNAALLAEGRS